VDPTHIKLKETPSPGTPSVKYEWQGADINVQSQVLDMDASITKIGEEAAPLIDIVVQALHPEVGIGSHNLIQATLENLNDHYVTVEILIARVAEMELLDPVKKQIILGPKENKNADACPTPRKECHYIPK